MHIRAFFCIYGAYTGLFLHIRSIYGPFFAYTEHIRAFFSLYGAYTGHFFAYTEHIRGFFIAYTEHIRSCFLHIRSIYGAHTCIYSTFFPDTGHILGIYEHIRYVVEKFGKIYFG